MMIPRSHCAVISLTAFALAILALCLLLSGCATTSPPVNVPAARHAIAWLQLSTANDTGYRAPITYVGLDAETLTTRFLIHTGINVSPTSKIDYGRVLQLNTTGDVTLRAGRAFFGAGAVVNRIKFLDQHVTRNGTYPFVLVGWQWSPRGRSFASWLAGQDKTYRQKVLALDTTIDVSKHLRLGYKISKTTGVQRQTREHFGRPNIALLVGCRF